MRSKNAVFSGSLMCLKTCTNEVCSAKQTRRTDVHLTACKDRFFFSISVFFRSEFSALEFISEEFKKKNNNLFDKVEADDICFTIKI